MNETIAGNIERKRPWLWCIAALPAILPLIVLTHYHLDIVWNDAWDFAQLLVKSHRGTLRFGEFWVAHNEHRIPIPYMVMYVLARLTHWNTKAEVYFGYVLVCVLSILYAMLIRTLGNGQSPLTRIWLWFLVNLMIFSPIQCENWVFGFAACVNFIPIPCMVGAMLLLYRKGLMWKSVLLSGLLVEISVLSMAMGLFIWVLLLPLLLVLPAAREQRMRFILLWIAMIVFSLVIQFWGYHSYSWATKYYSGGFLGRVTFFFAFLGNPMNFEHPGWQNLTIVLGVVVTLMYAVVVIWLLRQWINGDVKLVELALPWAVLGAYGFTGALLGALGRAGLGIDQAVTSRYTTIAIPVLICFIGVMYLPGTRALIPGYLRSALVALIFANLLLGSLRATTQYKRQMGQLRESISHMMFIDLISEPYGRELNGQFEDLRERVDALSETGYLQTRLIHNSDISVLMPRGADEPAVRATSGEVHDARMTQEPGYMDIWGWAYLPAKHRGADAVLITVDDENNVPRLCGIAQVGYLSEDVANALGEEFMNCGWLMHFPVNRLPHGQHTLRCWSFDCESQSAYPLAGSEVKIAS